MASMATCDPAPSPRPLRRERQRVAVASKQRELDDIRQELFIMHEQVASLTAMINSVGAKVDEFSLHGLGPPPGFCNCGDLAKSVVDMLSRLEILLFQRMPSLAL